MDPSSIINSTISSETLTNSLNIVGENFFKNIIALLIYTVGMVGYAIIIWHFYRKLAKRDIFDVDIKRHKSFRRGFLRDLWDFFEFLFRYLVLFPIITFLFFGVLSTFLLFLSKSQSIHQILLISMTIIASARFASYYSEDLAKDIAKLIPFALLGVFIVDPSFFSIDLVQQRISEIPNFFTVMIQYMVFVVIMEFILVLIDRIIFWTFKIKERDD